MKEKLMRGTNTRTKMQEPVRCLLFGEVEGVVEGKAELEGCLVCS
jgi:hypothetical protein